MTVLPIVDRELRVRARQASTYVTRWVAVGLALLVGIPLLMTNNPWGGPPDGKLMFIWLASLTLAWCILEARQTADCLSSERREGTLGLLFLTDLKGYDVVLGKLAATGLNSVYGLVAILPVLGLGLLAGGVTGAEFGRVILVLLNTLLLALSMGLWVSARSHDDQKSLVATLLLMLGIGGGLVLLDLLRNEVIVGQEFLFSLGSPGYALFRAFDANYPASSPGEFWYSLLVIHALSWVLLLAAGRRVTKTLVEGEKSEVQREVAREGQGISRTRSESGRQALNLNPIFWLADRGRGHRVAAWGLAALLLCFAIVQFTAYLNWDTRGTPGVWINIGGLGSMLGHLAMAYLVASAGSRFFAVARGSGALELLMVTPLRDREIMQGQWLHLRRLLAAPLAVVLIALLVQMNAWRFNPHLRPDGSYTFLIPVIMSIVSIIMQTFALNLYSDVAGSFGPQAGFGGGQSIFLYRGSPVAFVCWLSDLWLSFLLQFIWEALGLCRWGNNPDDRSQCIIHPVGKAELENGRADHCYAPTLRVARPAQQ